MSEKSDKDISRQITRLMWQALLQTKVKFVVSFVGHSINFCTHFVLVPYLVAITVQHIIEKDTDKIGFYALSIVIASALAGAVQWVAVWSFNRAGTTGVEYITKRIFNDYLEKDYEFFGNNFVGALGSNITTLRRSFLDYQLQVGFNVPRIAVTLVAMLVVVWLQSPILALVILASLVVNVTFTFTFARYRLQFRRQVSEAASDVAAVVGDALSHGTTVKSYASEAYERSRLDHVLGRYTFAQLKSWDLFTPMAFIRNFISMITIAILLVISARLYEDGSISIAIIALVQLYVLRLFNTMVDIGEMIKAYDQLMGDAHQPVALMMATSSIHDPSTPKKLGLPVNVLSFNNISYRYPDAQDNLHAVKDFSLSITKGEKIGIVGYSGSGKSTLTKLLLRFMDVDQGSITLNDIDVRSLTQHKLRSVISYVPQEPLLFHRSIADNILYATVSNSEDDMKKAAQLAYVDEFIDELPKGYKTIVGERGVKLSGGQRQRVAIARALLKDAPILVLDEATSALDSRSEQLIQRALWNLMEDRTAIVIAHRLSTVQKMDRIIVMDKGLIAEEGTHSELLKDKSGIYAQLWAHQSGGYLQTDKSNSK